MVGVVAGRELPAQPSEDEFRLGLRNGILLCNALNKVQPGAIPKVVEAPSDAIIIPDGAALSVYQYFENIRNFLDSVGEMGIPAFEASDLEQGGKSSRVVNCVLALKSYNDWKEGGAKGAWKFSGNQRTLTTGKQVFRRNSDLFVNSLSKSSSPASVKSPNFLLTDQDANEMENTHALHTFVRDLFWDKKTEDISLIVGNMLGKVMQEFGHRLALQNAKSRSHSEDMVAKEHGTHIETENHKASDTMRDGTRLVNTFHDCNSDNHALKHVDFAERYGRTIQELRSALHSIKQEMKMLLNEYQQGVTCLGKHLNGLARSASHYQKVLEENRKLYNQVQDLKGNIRVYCRIRPCLSGESTASSSVEVVDEQVLSVLASSKYGKGKKSFTFNKVFGPSSTQEEVFADMQPLIRSVLDGYNVCIFAYGQTGSGKTYTMTGPSELTHEKLGVNYRALRDLFLLSEQRKDRISYQISVQMIEIYNEQVRDILITDGRNKRLDIRNSSVNGVNVPDANKIPVTSTSEVINLMNLGNRNRAFGSTAMNDRSSRSHSCLTVHVQGKDLTSGSTLRGCMHLVDLAGSERADKSEAVGERLKEAQHINRSLSALGDVISSLAQKNSHVPYRNSKLTQLLQDSMGGQAKTLMFVHISPELDAVAETLSTLKFSERVSTVELGAARANKDVVDVKELKEQVATLKAALLQKERDLSALQLTPLKLDRTTSFGSSASHLPSRASEMSFRWSCSSTSRKQSLGGTATDSHQLSSPFVEEERCISNYWVYMEDLDLVNKHDQRTSNISPQRRHSLGKGGSDKSPQEEIVVPESDDQTSDSSEFDCQWQISLSRSNSMPNGLGTNPRRPGPKHPKTSTELRSMIPQPPARRIPNGIYTPLHKQHGRQTASVEGKRKPLGGVGGN